MNLPADYPYRERKLGFEWANGSRAARIDEVMKPLSEASIEDSMKLQTDITSIPARRLVRLLAPLSSGDVKTKAALNLLREWDAIERADSAPAALTEVWISRHLGKVFLAAVLPKSAAEAVGSPDVAVMLDALEKPDARFAPERDGVLLASLASAYLDMEKLQGPNFSGWRWGKLHHSFPEHPLFEILEGDLRAKLQPGPFPKSGGPFTLNQSGYRRSDFRQTGGPSFRIVLDVGEWDNSRAVNYPGQSGNSNDPHYSNLTGLWLKGDYFPLLYTRTAVEKEIQKRILLAPKQQ